MLLISHLAVVVYLVFEAVDCEFHGVRIVHYAVRIGKEDGGTDITNENIGFCASPSFRSLPLLTWGHYGVVELSDGGGGADPLDGEAGHSVQQPSLVLALCLHLERVEEVAGVHVPVEAGRVEPRLAQLAVEGDAGHCGPSNIEVCGGRAELPEGLQHSICPEGEAGQEHVGLGMELLQFFKVQLRATSLWS